MLYHNIYYSLYDLRFFRMVNLIVEYSIVLFQKKRCHSLMSHVWNFLTLISIYRALHMNNNIQVVHTVIACMQSSVWKYIVHLKQISSSSKKNVIWNCDVFTNIVMGPKVWLKILSPHNSQPLIQELCVAAHWKATIHLHSFNFFLKVYKLIVFTMPCPNQQSTRL